MSMIIKREIKGRAANQAIAMVVPANAKVATNAISPTQNPTIFPRNGTTLPKVGRILKNILNHINITRAKRPLFTQVQKLFSSCIIANSWSDP